MPYCAIARHCCCPGFDVSIIILSSCRCHTTEYNIPLSSDLRGWDRDCGFSGRRVRMTKNKRVGGHRHPSVDRGSGSTRTRVYRRYYRPAGFRQNACPLLIEVGLRRLSWIHETLCAQRKCTNLVLSRRPCEIALRGPGQITHRPSIIWCRASVCGRQANVSCVFYIRIQSPYLTTTPIPN